MDTSPGRLLLCAISCLAVVWICIGVLAGDIARVYRLVEERYPLEHQLTCVCQYTAADIPSSGHIGDVNP